MSFININITKHVLLSELETGMDQRGDHMKMNFDYFQIQK